MVARALRPDVERPDGDEPRLRCRRPGGRRAALSRLGHQLEANRIHEGSGRGVLEPDVEGRDLQLLWSPARPDRQMFPTRKRTARVCNVCVSSSSSVLQADRANKDERRSELKRLTSSLRIGVRETAGFTPGYYRIGPGDIEPARGRRGVLRWGRQLSPAPRCPHTHQPARLSTRLIVSARAHES